MRFACDGALLSSTQVLNLGTRYGDLDLSFVPSGTQGFSDLAPRAVPMAVRGSTVRVAALEDVIRSKEAADRPKDRRALPLLRQLLAEIRRLKEE